MPKIRYEDTATHRLQMRREIIRAAIPLFLEHGIAVTTMDQIAGVVGIGRTTLYNYFEHKEEILLAYLVEQFERVGDVERPPGVQAEDPLTALRELVEWSMAERAAPRHVEYERLFGMLMAEASPAARRKVTEHLEELLSRVRALAEQVLERGTRAGTFQARPAPYHAAVLMAMIDAAVRSLRAGDLPDREAACDLVMEGFLRLVGGNA